jgi:ribonucleoside-diphosphate reductase alpha chain
MLSVIKEYVDVTGNKDIDKSPFYKSGANDIDWMAKIKMQAAAQRNICHSISVTYNLPNDVKLEEVKKLYEAAWKNGLKGITIYRDGCKSGVLVRKNDKTSGKEVENSGDASLSATKRPKSLPCDVHHIKVTKKLDKARQFEYIVAIGLLNNKPYEVFAFENGKVDKKFHKGNLIKEGRGKYHLELTDENGEVTLLKNITVDTSEHEDALTRMVSMSLRHAVPIEYVVQQLEKSSDSGSFNKALVRGLKKYIADGAKVAGENCPTCQAALQRREGCKTCPSCGWAACG